MYLFSPGATIFSGLTMMLGMSWGLDKSLGLKKDAGRVLSVLSDSTSSLLIWILSPHACCLLHTFRMLAYRDVGSTPGRNDCAGAKKMKTHEIKSNFIFC
jgi:hypothetical protein